MTTIVGVSPDQNTKRFLTMERVDAEVDLAIHSRSGTGVNITVLVDELRKSIQTPDLSISGICGNRGKPKMLKLELKEKQSLYIHTVSGDCQEGSGWAIFVSRDDFTKALDSVFA